MAHEILISLENVGVCYRRRLGFGKRYWALSDVSFDIRKGETVGILGGNGAGKSSLLRLLAGIIEADTGRLDIKAGIFAQLLSLQVGFDRELSGRENTILSGMLLGRSKNEMIELLPGVKEFSGLGDFFDESVRTYSTGMRSRLGFAVSSCVSPDILLIDEVLGVGDSAFQAKSRKLMEEKIASDQTVVLVSHNEKTMRDLCDRIVWVEDGVSVFQGDPVEVYERYNESMSEDNSA
jgi:lipopolysaccharide transport system ATP-binding protein